MSTALDLKQQTRRSLGLAGDDTAALPDVDVLEAVNSALASITTEREWVWQFDTEVGVLTADDDTLALPAGYVKSSSFTVLFADGERTLISQLDQADIEGDDETPAEPLFYSISGGELYLWPTPDDAYGYRHFYYKLETPLVDDADEPLLPDQFTRWAVVEAALRLHLRTVSPEKYNELRTEAAEWRDRAIRWNFRQILPLPEITLTRESVWQDV